jgi:hypothetical protein
MPGRWHSAGKGVAFLALAILLAAGTALGQESEGDDRGRRDNFDGVERSGGTFRERVRERLDSVRESSRGRPRVSSFESDDGPRSGSSRQDVGDRRERIRQQFRSSRDEQVRLKSQESIEVEKERIKRLDEKYKPKTGAVSEQEGGSDGATAQPPARSADASVDSGDRQVSEPLSSSTTTTTTTTTTSLPSRNGNFVEPPAAHWGQKLANDQADAATKADEAMVSAKLEEKERERAREGSRPMGMPDRGHAATTTASKSSSTSSGERSIVTQALLDELEKKNRVTPPTLEGKVDGIVEIMAFVSRMGEGDQGKMQASIEGIYQRAKSLATQLPTLVVHETPAPVNPSSSSSFTSSSTRLSSPSEGQRKLPQATGTSTATDIAGKLQTSSTSSSSDNRAGDAQGEKTSGTN